MTEYNIPDDMSYELPDLPTSLNIARVIDSRTDLNSRDRRTYNVFDGPQDITYVRIQPNGGVNNSVMNYTLNPPSNKTFIDRRIYTDNTIDITFTGQSNGVGIELLQMAGCENVAVGVSSGNAYYDAPRCQPWANAMSNVEIQIANDRVTQNLNQYFRAFTRYNRTTHYEDVIAGMSPNMTDQSLEYSDLDGFSRSELRGYGDNANQCPRGGFVGCQILRNDSTGLAGDIAIVRMRIIEPIYLSPLIWEGSNQDVGFIGANTLELKINIGGRGNGVLGGLVGSLWSHSSLGSTYTSAVANVVDSQVLISYLTPDILQNIPSTNFYSYQEPVLYPTHTTVPIVPNNVVTVSMNNVQLNSIPSRLYLYVSENDQFYNMLKTDTYFSIENVQISFDNRDTILANATQLHLYNIATKNGCNLSWTQFTKKIGSVLALDFGEDIPLRTGQAVGLRGSYNLRVTITARNNYNVNVTPTFHCLVISEGVMIIDNGQVTRNVGILDEMDIINSKNIPANSYSPSGSVYGGNFFSNIRDRIGNAIKTYTRPIINMAKRVIPVVAPQYAPLVDSADNIAKMFGLGLKGQGLVGGRNLTRAQLSRMLHK